MTIRMLCVLALLVIPHVTSAAMVSYQATNVAGSTWRYDYTVTNDSLANGISEFSIFFPLGAYESLAVVGSPDGWDSIVAQPDPALPDAGFFDSLALNNPIALSSSATGFAVQFLWLGQGAPGAQPFHIVDPDTFATIETGLTVPAVPLPAGVWLLGSALVGLATMMRRRIE